MTKTYRYQTCCVNSTGEKINAMRDIATKITYGTMLRNCADLIDWATSVGYVRGPNQGLTLKQDPLVTYHKAIYDGLPCYYLVWSAIEYIWVNDNV